MWRKSRTILALDFGAKTVKGLLLEAGRGKPVVQGLAQVTLPENGSAYEDVDPATQALASLLSDLGPDSRKAPHVITSLAGDKVNLKQIRTMKLPETELRSSLAYEARKHMAVKGEIVVDYQILHERESEYDLLLAIVPKSEMDGHARLLSHCEIKPGTMDAPALALLNALTLSHPDRETETVAIVHIGASTTHLCFRSGGESVFAREIPLAGDRFTDGLRRDLKTSTPEAEEAKQAKGIFGALGSPATEGHTLKAVQALMREIMRSIRFFLNEGNREKVDHIFFSGGSACDGGLRDHLDAALGIQSEILDPFAAMEANTEIKAQDRNYLFVQAAGLALRKAHELVSN